MIKFRHAIRLLKNIDRRSFTLLELLIVVGILAVLAAVAIVVLNPAELLRQTRDSERIENLTIVDDALSLLYFDNPSVFMGVSSTVCLCFFA